MKRLSASVEIRRPVEEVFDFLNDQRNHARLNPHNFQRFRVISPNSIGVGAKSEFILKSGVVQEAVQLQVISSEPGRLLVEQGYFKDTPFRTIWRLKSLGPDRTEVEMITEYQNTGPTRLFAQIVQNAFRRISTRLLIDLARQLNPTA